jgi:serine/threonine-protein kinase
MTQAPSVPATVAGGRYRLIEKIGAGGAGSVWRGHDSLLDRDVAIKVVVHQAAAEPALLAEARAAAQLHHPYITDVYDVGTQAGLDGSLSYVVMELVHGMSLRALAECGTEMPWRTATGVVAQVAEALAVAHGRGLVHRDISASNVILTETGVKVVDFGIAAALGSPECDDRGVVQGNARYAAPERITDPTRPVEPAGDVYSLGVLWYRLLTGHFPWPSGEPVELLEAHVYQPPAPLTGPVPPRLADLCLRCLAKDPAQRPTTRDLFRSLAPFATAALPEPDGAAADPVHTPTEPFSVDRSRRLPIVVAVALILAALAGVWIYGDGGATDREGQTSAATAVSPGATPAIVPAISAAASRPADQPSPTGGGAGAKQPPEVATAGATTGPPLAATATSTGAADPTGSPTPSPSVTALTGVEVAGVGGTVQVSCTGRDGKLIMVDSTTPAPGYTVTKLVAGPAKEIHVVFGSSAATTDIRASCAAGVVQPRVQEY